MVLKPDTGYFPFDICNVFCFIFDAGCFGITNAVCFNSERSLHSADINGKSICLLRSRNIFISIGVAGAVIELVTIFGDSFVTSFIDAFVRGRVVVTAGACAVRDGVDGLLMSMLLDCMVVVGTSSIGGGIGGLSDFFGYGGGGGGSRFALGSVSIEFKMLSSDLDRANIDAAVVIGLGRNGIGGGASYDEHRLAIDGL